jgi:hypothetical protein
MSTFGYTYGGRLYDDEADRLAGTRNGGERFVKRKKFPLGFLKLGLYKS